MAVPLSPNGKTVTQIIRIQVRKKCQKYRGANVDSDHFMVKIEIWHELPIKIKAKGNCKLQTRTAFSLPKLTPMVNGEYI